MTPLPAYEDPDNGLLVDVIEALEEHGLSREEFQLHDFVDSDALQKAISTGSTVTVGFTVHGIQVTVSPDSVTATRSSMKQ